MGRSFLCLGQISSPRRLPKQHDRSNVSFTTSIVEYMKPSCLCTQPPKTQKPKAKTVNKELTTSQDEWFSASSTPIMPCRDDENSLHINNNARVFPSNDDHINDDVMFDTWHSFNSDKQGMLIQMEDGRRSDDVSCLRSRKSGKVKKRVSFKLPEEADIFIFCSHNSDPKE